MRFGMIKLLGATLALSMTAICYAESYTAAGSFVVKGLDFAAEHITREQIEKAFSVNLDSGSYSAGECNPDIWDANFTVLSNKMGVVIAPDDNPGVKFPKKPEGKLSALKKFQASRYWFTLDKNLDAFLPIVLGGKDIKPGMSYDDFKSIFPVSAKRRIENEDKTSKHYAVVLDRSGEVAGVKASIKVEALGYSDHVDFGFKNNKLISIRLVAGDDC